MRRAAIIICAIAAFAHPALGLDRTVNILSWPDYIDANVLQDFTRETGIKVVYDTYDSEEAFDAKFIPGKADYDVVDVSGPLLQRLIKVGAYQRLDKSKLSNIKGLWPEIMARLAVYDPGNQYAVNYMWFTTGVAYNVEKAKQRLGDKGILSWDAVFKPENLRKFSDCGVNFLDSPEDMFVIAMKFMGVNPESKRPEDIHRAAEALIRLKPFIKSFNSSEYVNALANGDICLAVGWTGDAMQARNRAMDASNGVNINFVAPREGAPMSMDNLAIPKEAPHVVEAYALIDYLLRPEVAARNSKASNLANGVATSKSFLDKAILDNPSIYPSDDALRGLYVVPGNDPATQKTVDREWARIKSGNNGNIAKGGGPRPVPSTGKPVKSRR